MSRLIKKSHCIAARELLAALIILLHAAAAMAANIDPGNIGSRYAWSENTGWLCFAPEFGPGVIVTDTAVTGFAWSENTGWINLSPQHFGGVTNDEEGNLKGYAWGENVGWISFSCENKNACPASDYGVIIDAAGRFSGQAWSETIGWINFCMVSMPGLSVLTSWLPAAPITTTTTTIPPGDGCTLLIKPVRIKVPLVMPLRIFRFNREDGKALTRQDLPVWDSDNLKTLFAVRLKKYGALLVLVHINLHIAQPGIHTATIGDCSGAIEMIEGR